MLALLLIPVCLWGVTALHSQSSARNWVGAVASLAALILSHNLMAIAGGVVLIGFWLLLAIGYRKPLGLLRCGGAALLAALLSAGFWLPALADLPFVQNEIAQKRVRLLGDLFLQRWQLTGFQSPFLDSRAGNPLRPLNTFGAATWLAVGGGAAQCPVLKRQGTPGLGLQWRHFPRWQCSL